MIDRTKAMDSLIAQDADLIGVPSGVTEADREVLIRLSNPDDETAQRIRRGLIYTWEARQIANHRQQAAAEERAKISDWLDEMDRGLKKKQVDNGGDVMAVMGTVSLVGQLSTLIRMNEYEQWSAWGKQEHLK
jgi:hypothetical protein